MTASRFWVPNPYLEVIMPFKAALLQPSPSKFASEEKKIHGDIEAIVLRENGGDDLSARDKRDLVRLRDNLVGQRRILDRLLRE